MNLTEFTEAVNALGRAEAQRHMTEYHAGRALFGAKHYDFPESMMKLYHDQGMTPQQAFTQIQREAGI